MERGIGGAFDQELPVNKKLAAPCLLPLAPTPVLAVPEGCRAGAEAQLPGSAILSSSPYLAHLRLTSDYLTVPTRLPRFSKGLLPRRMRIYV